jgi:glucose/arabinose dehydrogenase
MKKLLVFFLVVISNWCFSQDLDLELELVAEGFSSPVDIKHAGDERLFVVERGGQIKIINSDGTINPTPFLNISSIITSGGERGLLGLAFHPNYAKNGYFYVNYTNLSGNTVIARYTVSADPDIADSDSQHILLTENQPFSNHNGGHLCFGPDGMLYIGMGDGGMGGDPQNNSQTFTNRLGKMLRLNVDIPAPYIPSDNPFFGSPDIPQEIWAYGLRNPWRFSFDRETGELWIADVGQDNWEEINRVAHDEAPLNYGWRCYEGNEPFNTGGCPPQNEMTFPIAVYSISSSNCAITGGYVYRGSSFPLLQGLYFFADYCSNQIGTITQENELEFHGTFGAGGITSFGEDVNGELYIAAFNGGRIYKLRENTVSVEDFTQELFTMYPNPASDFLQIQSLTPLITIQVLDLSGQLIMEITPSPNNLSTQLNVQGLSSGLYIVSGVDQHQNKSFKKLLIP